ncbi:hypothetical protein VCR12J2_1020156 [Vibrio coralliirubri]|nr:hypothetical protein VCR6J2_230104 [Vibrio coralliirubri]CDT79639.1 hypothetical protein VCR12J2_1020156 [Vibrio coralliirubri]CDT98914.1 hypothetical protein VCR8J2_60017 [Vibrio coralliirubri]
MKLFFPSSLFADTGATKTIETARPSVDITFVTTFIYVLRLSFLSIVRERKTIKITLPTNPV